MAQNLIEKITQKFTIDNKEEIHSGDFVSISPAYVMTHDNTAAVIPKFQSIGKSKVANPRQIVYTLDHNVQDTGEKNLAKYKKIEQFAADQEIDFYPAGRGIGHQIMCEEGYAWPGTFVVASDSHSNMYGGLGCLGTPIVRTDAAAIWATGKTWWQIPPVARVVLSGKLLPGVTGKDVIITLAGFFNKDEVLNHALEFVGDGIQYLSLDQRLTIANMTTEWGALAGVFPVDEVTISWLDQRIEFVHKRAASGVPSDKDFSGKGNIRLNTERLVELKNNPPKADENALYSKELHIDLSTITPHVSGPNSVKVMHPVNKISQDNIKINKAYLVSCVNSRVEDIAEAARVIADQKISDHVDFYLSAASSEVQEISEQRGDWQLLLEAGAKELPPGCGPCIGLGIGTLEDGEVGISATNRNFKGRMGSRDAIAYLASPAVVAASAVAGKITAPFNYKDITLNAELKTSAYANGKQAVKLIKGFPQEINGNIIFCNQDNINTDGIYAGKYTYREDMTPQMMAEVIMENYDPDFRSILKSGDILVSGFNFGTGSSREQAATALKHAGIQCIIAGSYSETYKRNAFNNGFMCLECAELVDFLREQYAQGKLTVRTEQQITIDYSSAVILFDNQKFKFAMPGQIAQQLVLNNGIENQIRQGIM